MTQMHLDSNLSRKEYYDGKSLREDYRTAHHRAGDSGYQKVLPETCHECYTNEAYFLAEGLPAPTKVDQADER